VEIAVNNLQDRVEWTPKLKEMTIDVLSRVAENEGVPPEAEAGVTLVDDAGIHEMNREYRGVDAPTDVISFALNDEAEDDDVSGPSPDNLLLGDIVISLERAQAQAQEYGHSLAREVAFLAVHGLLHLLGYDHSEPEDEAEMMARTEAALEAMGIVR
jgi:probable rRNA maturation factor